MKNKKIVTNYTWYYSTMTSKIIKESIENLFEFDRDKP